MRKTLIIECIIIMFGFTFLMDVNTTSVRAMEYQVEYYTPECYQQAKDLWSNYTIGGGSIGDNGCGIISLTNAVNYVTGNYIDPIELANYAYSIDAYNGSMGGGTARWILYNQLDAYEKKYGFEVIEAGRDSNVLFPKFINHLKNGGVTVAHVYGHFIAIVGYNEIDKTYLVYDCAANPTKRQSYPYGTWMTETQLTTLQYMTVDWFCLLSRTEEGIVRLDQEGHIYQNSKATVSYSVTNTENIQIPISGFALDTRGIESFYYVVDSSKEENPLLSVYKEGILEQFIDYQDICDIEKIGFEGLIDTTHLTIGEHRIIVSAKTKNGGVRDVAEIIVNKSNKECSVDQASRTYTIDMSRYMGQKDIIENWPEAGIDDYCFRANYGSVIDLGQLDLSIYKKAEIVYSTDQSFIADKNGVQSVIGFKSANLDFGYHGKELDLTNSIAYANMSDAIGGWIMHYTATIDLKDVEYCGSVYLNGYNQEGDLYVVRQVILYYDDDYIFHHYQQATCTDPLICTDCGEKIGIPLGHNWINATCQHAKTCARCGSIEGEVSDHKWEEATCTTPTNCIYCGLTKGTPLGHDYHESLILPTCEEQGYNEHKCSRCQDIYKTDMELALGHNLIHHEELLPTCTVSGYHAYDTCSRCDYTTYEEIQILGHHYETSIVEATCTKGGYHLNHCTRCNYEYMNQKVKPLGHQIEHYEAVLPTCTTDGYHAYDACTRCDYTTYEKYEALGHDIIHYDGLLPTCLLSGYDAYDTCSRCEYTTYEELSPLGHQYVSTIVKPTTEREGYTEHTCINCGKFYIDNYTEVLKKNCKRSSVVVILVNLTAVTSIVYIIKKKKC